MGKVRKNEGAAWGAAAKLAVQRGGKLPIAWIPASTGTSLDCCLQRKAPADPSLRLKCSRESNPDNILGERYPPELITTISGVRADFYPL